VSAGRAVPTSGPHKRASERSARAAAGRVADNTDRPLRIGTRGSTLALAQARAVAHDLGVPTELVTITTAGDVDRALGDKSRWVGALETALLDGDIDLAVHSAKDVPGELAPGTAIVATPRRADPLDVLVGENRLVDVREAARVGTSALRRRAQLLAVRPDLVITELRGNVDTRLRKRTAGEVDVLVLAAAGLDRLDRRREAGGALAGEVFVPAPGQGVIAVQARLDSPAADIAAAACHGRTLACLNAERTAVRELSASCHTPVGIHAADARVRGFVGLPDGSAWLVDEVTVAAPHGAADGSGAPEAPDRSGAPEAADALAALFEAAARELARRMLAAGAADLLRASEAMAAR
jgi:hydroxymethylbilane synthase